MPSHSHVLLWHDGPDAPIGAEGLQGWTKYSLDANPYHFFPCGDGQVGLLAAVAIERAIERGTDVTVAWGVTPNFRATPAADLEPIFRRLQPAVLVLSERADKRDRWTIAAGVGGAPESVPAAAIERAVSLQIADLYPTWQHGLSWSATAFLLRHALDAETLGLVAPRELSLDEICVSVADDPAVRAAATPRDLVRARLAAQSRAGVPEAMQAPVYSGQVDSMLLPIVGTVLHQREIPLRLAELRRTLRRTYGDAGEVVLQFALRTFVHDGRAIADLREAAQEASAEPAA
jgi:hypothetical protein